MDVALGRTMSKRVIGGALALALASQGCNAQTTMVAGAVGIAVGAAVLASADSCEQECTVFDVLPMTIGVTAGYAIMVTSGVVLLGGALGQSYDVASQALGPKPSDAARKPVSFEGKSPAATTVALHVRVAARAARCEQAAMMANRLSAVEPELVVALIKGDSYVSHCIEVASNLGGSAPTLERATPGAAPTSAPEPASPAPESSRPGAP